MSQSQATKSQKDSDSTSNLPSYEDAQRGRPYLAPCPIHGNRRVSIPLRRVSLPPPRYPSSEDYDPEAQARAVQAAATTLIVEDQSQPDLEDGQTAALGPRRPRRRFQLWTTVVHGPQDDLDFDLEPRHTRARDIFGCVCCAIVTFVVAVAFGVVIFAVLHA